MYMYALPAENTNEEEMVVVLPSWAETSEVNLKHHDYTRKAW